MYLSKRVVGNHQVRLRSPAARTRDATERPTSIPAPIGTAMIAAA
jgi:hypothetical protein